MSDPYDPWVGKGPARPWQKPNKTTWTGAELLFPAEEGEDVAKPVEKPRPEDETTQGGWFTG
jgi:hypothetical protein